MSNGVSWRYTNAVCQCQMASPGVIYMQCVNVKWRLLALYTLQCVNVKWRLLAFKPPDAYIHIQVVCQCQMVSPDVQTI